MTLENALGKWLNVMDAGSTAISRVQQLLEHREKTKHQVGKGDANKPELKVKLTVKAWDE